MGSFEYLLAELKSYLITNIKASMTMSQGAFFKEAPDHRDKFCQTALRDARVDICYKQSHGIHGDVINHSATQTEGEKIRIFATVVNQTDMDFHSIAALEKKAISLTEMEEKSRIQHERHK